MTYLVVGALLVGLGLGGILGWLLACKRYQREHEEIAARRRLRYSKKLENLRITAGFEKEGF